MPRDVAVISLHEKGFWQADLYRDASELTNDEWEGVAPDAFLTRKKGSDMQDAIDHACRFWPAAEIRIARDDEEDEDES